MLLFTIRCIGQCATVVLSECHDHAAALQRKIKAHFAVHMCRLTALVLHLFYSLGCLMTHASLVCCAGAVLYGLCSLHMCFWAAEQTTVLHCACIDMWCTCHCLVLVASANCHDGIDQGHSPCCSTVCRKDHVLLIHEVLRIRVWMASDDDNGCTPEQLPWQPECLISRANWRSMWLSKVFLRLLHCISTPRVMPSSRQV